MKAPCSPCFEETLRRFDPEPSVRPNFCRSTLRLFNASTILIDFGPHFLSFSAIMRLLVEILIVAAVIYFGWNKPYKEYAARANKTITSKLDGLGGTLQKHQDSSVKRY